ncbi:hypothetical protein E4U13_000688, partial [Claviceps humidiphila]
SQSPASNSRRPNPVPNSIVPSRLRTLIFDDVAKGALATHSTNGQRRARGRPRARTLDAPLLPPDNDTDADEESLEDWKARLRLLNTSSLALFSRISCDQIGWSKLDKFYGLLDQSPLYATAVCGPTLRHEGLSVKWLQNMLQLN